MTWEGRGLLQPVLYCIGNAPSLGAAGEDLADGWIVQDAQGGKEAGRQRGGICFPAIGQRAQPT